MNSMAKNTAWMVGGQYLSVGFQTGYFILLARLLGPAQYGVYMGVVAAAAILCQYTALGSGFVFLRYVSGNHRLHAPYFGNALLASTAVGLPLTLVFAVGSAHLMPGTGILLAVVVGLSDALFAQFATCASLVFQAVEQMQFTAALIFLNNLLRFVVVAVMAGLLRHVSALQWAIGALAVSVLVAIVAILLIVLRLGKPQYSGFRFLGRYTLEGLVFAATCSTVTAYNDLDKVMLNHYGMTVANGIYSAAYRVVNLCTVPITAIYMAAIPTFFSYGESGCEHSIALTRRLLRKSTVVGILSAIGMVIAAPIMPLILGKGYAASVSAVRWLALIPLFRSFQFSAGDVLTGMDRQRLRFGLQTGAVALNLLLNYILIPRYSWVGAAIASLATDGSLAAVMWISLKKVSSSVATVSAAC